MSGHVLTFRQQSKVPLYGNVPSGSADWLMMRDLATSAGVEQSEATKPEQIAEHRWHSKLSPVYTTIACVHAAVVRSHAAVHAAAMARRLRSMHESGGAGDATCTEAFVTEQPSWPAHALVITKRKWS